VLQSLWQMSKRPKIGLARKDMGGGQWVVLALDAFARSVCVSAAGAGGERFRKLAVSSFKLQATSFKSKDWNLVWGILRN